jgi:hypothetical protein
MRKARSEATGAKRLERINLFLLFFPHRRHDTMRKARSEATGAHKFIFTFFPHRNSGKFW